MGDWYQVVKTIKGHQYRYLQQTYREGAHVRTRNRYLGRVDTGVSGSQSGSRRTATPAASVPSPLFQNPSDFGAAMLKQFDAPQWGKDAGEQLLGSAVSGGAAPRRTGTSHRPRSRFDFGRDVSHDETAKRRFHLRARRQLRELAAELGLQSGDFDVRSNKGGVAVSGEITLHTDHLYVSVQQFIMGDDDMGILFRRSAGRDDDGGHGGGNYFAPVDLLNDPAELAQEIRRVCLKSGVSSVTTTDGGEAERASPAFRGGDEGSAPLHLPRNRRITDAYPRDFLGINMRWLEEQANERGYNLYDALIKRVDSTADIGEKVAAIHGIMDEILSVDPHELPATTHERSVPPGTGGAVSRASGERGSEGIPGRR